MITIYTKPNCPACEQAKALLREHGKQFVTQRIGQDIPVEMLTEEYPLARSAPIITVNGEYLGGLHQLKEYLGEGSEQLLLG